MFISNLTVVWKLLRGRLLAAGGSVASGWVCLTALTKVDIFNRETLQRAQRSSGFSTADVAGDGWQPCSSAGFMDEVAWALLGRKGRQEDCNGFVRP